MDGNEPTKTRVIHVQPSNVDKVEEIIPLSTGKNDNAINQLQPLNTDNSSLTLSHVQPATPESKDPAAPNTNKFLGSDVKFTDTEAELFAVKEEKVENEQGKMKKKKKKKKKKRGRRLKSLFMPHYDTKGTNDEDKHADGKTGSDSKVNVGADGKGKKKKTITKDKKKTKGKEEAITEELADAEEKTEAATGNATNRTKLPCVFGFIATWLAKRKEKRREKKRKAIAARASPQQRLVVFEHRTTRGGTAFTIEVDSRPSFAKPILPPIKQTSGPIRRERQRNAVFLRAETLAQKRDAAREFEKKKINCKKRRDENDYQFRQKAHVSIRQRQANADWNRNILIRCKSRLRAPSAMSPSQHSDNEINEPSAGSSFGSIHGPSCFSEEEDDRGVGNVDKMVDIPIF